MPIDDLVPPEGPFVRSLRDAGCVIIGKTRATEFALGTYNLERRTPWNPCDLDVHRIPGGSSNGSACAAAAGFCDFAIGTDTGGSVRQPAALCGLVGYRPTPGVWSIGGVFPLSPLLDTIGPLRAAPVKRCGYLKRSLQAAYPKYASIVSAIRTTVARLL